MNAMTFNSADLPTHLKDRARFQLWHEMFNADVTPAYFSCSEALPFHITFRAVQIGPLTYARASGTVTGARRTAAQAGSDSDYTLHINTSATPQAGSYLRREVDIPAGGALLIGSAEQALVGHEQNSWIDLRIPGTIFSAAFQGVERRQGMMIDPGLEAMQLLRRYLGLLDGPSTPASPHVIDHMATTIVDLAGLAIGARGDEAERAGVHGLRRARLEAVLDRINRNYAYPPLSAQSIGQELGLSARYVQDLLAATGKTLSDRVLELRLQHARKLLGAPASGELKIGEIIFASGFSDISYFNRCFRRRFGCTPGAAR